MATALVTGASGFLGRAMCRRLSAEGWRVIGVARNAFADEACAAVVNADVADPGFGEGIRERLAQERIDVVWHLAGRAHAHTARGQEAEYFRVNVNGTEAILRMVREHGIPRVVLASSVKAMGEGRHELQDESAQCEPETAYGKSKLAAERLVLGAPDIEGVVLRFCMIYGRGERGNMGRMLTAIRRGIFPPFPETKNRRSILYIEDALTACLAAGMHASAAGATFIVTDGRLYSTAEIDREIRRVLGRAEPTRGWPISLLRFAARAGDTAGRVIHRQMPFDSEILRKLTDSAAFSSNLIRQRLGVEPSWPLRTALQHMLAEPTEIGCSH